MLHVLSSLALYFRSFQSMSSDKESEDDALEVTDGDMALEEEERLMERGKQVKLKDCLIEDITDMSWICISSVAS